MDHKVLAAAGTVHVPERLSDEVLNFSVVFGSLTPIVGKGGVAETVAPAILQLQEALATVGDEQVVAHNPGSLPHDAR